MLTSRMREVLLRVMDDPYKMQGTSRAQQPWVEPSEVVTANKMCGPAVTEVRFPEVAIELWKRLVALGAAVTAVVVSLAGISLSDDCDMVKAAMAVLVAGAGRQSKWLLD